MAYATQQDLIDRFGAEELTQLTDRTNYPATTIDGTVVAKALGDAEALADSYLAKLYKLPLDPVPPVLTKFVSDIARYYLHGERVEKDDRVSRAHAEAVAWLKDVAKGLVVLEAAGVEAAQADGGSIQTSDDTRLFSRDSLAGY